MREWQPHQEVGDTRILVQHRRNQDAIGIISSPPAMGVTLRNGEVDDLRVLLGPGLELLDYASYQGTTRVKDASIGAEQKHHLLRGRVELERCERLAIQQGLLV